MLVGLQPPTHGFDYGVDAMTGKMTAVSKQSDGSQDETLGTPSLPALCQWDDSRQLFFLDAKMTVSDSQTPLELEGRWSVSWRSVLHAVMSAWPLGSKSSIEAKLWGNFKNVVEIAGIDAAMFYVAAVSVDMVTAGKSKKMSSSRLFEAMIRDYSLVDPQQYGLDAIGAATVKTYGQPKLSDLSIIDGGRGDWESWEPELKQSGLPSNAWLAWRRIRARIGVVQPELASSVFSTLTGGLADNIGKIPVGTPGADEFYETVSRWSAPSRIDWRLRQRWLEELLSVGVWAAVSEGSMWSEALSRVGDEKTVEAEVLSELAGSSVDRQLGFIAAMWSALYGKLDALPADGGDAGLETLILADQQLSTGLDVVDFALEEPGSDDAGAAPGIAGDESAGDSTGEQSIVETAADGQRTVEKPHSRQNSGKKQPTSGGGERQEKKLASAALSKKTPSLTKTGGSKQSQSTGKKPAPRKPRPVAEEGIIDYEMDVVTSDDLAG